MIETLPNNAGQESSPRGLAMKSENAETKYPSSASECFARSVAVFLLLLVFQATVFAQPVCPPLDGRNWNNDYRDPSQTGHLRVVERFHFNDNVRTLRGSARGSAGTLRGDLDYVLNHFPNHHPALDALVRLALRERNPEPLGMVHIDCRFQQARRVVPNDGMVPMLQAQYYMQSGRQREVVALLELATGLSPHDANVHYNAGLLYFRLNAFEKAREHGRRAYEMGFPLPGLRSMLARAGYPLND
mgnify:FL=1